MSEQPFNDHDAERLYLDLREKGSKISQAVETLGKSAGVIRDTHEYKSLVERARAYHDAMFAAANLFAMRYGLDTQEILTRRRTDATSTSD